MDANRRVRRKVLSGLVPAALLTLATTNLLGATSASAGITGGSSQAISSILSAASFGKTTGTGAAQSGYLAEQTDRVIFIELSRAHGKISGHLDLVFASTSTSGLQTAHGAITGTVSRSAIKVAITIEGSVKPGSLGQPWDKSQSVSGDFRGHDLVLFSPGPGGKLIATDFHPASVRDYDQAVGILHTCTARGGASACLVPIQPTPRAFLDVKHTSVVHFWPFVGSRPAPWIKLTQQFAGSCWEGSMAAESSHAWRCLSGNDLFDPCFAATNHVGSLLVCDPNPISKTGVLLKLTKPLPMSMANKGSQSGSPWLLELANHALCAPITGTSGFVTTSSGVQIWMYFGACTTPSKQQNGLVTVYYLDPAEDTLTQVPVLTEWD